jgi:hypothetical protein
MGGKLERTDLTALLRWPRAFGANDRQRAWERSHAGTALHPVGGGERARADENHQPPAAGMQLAPILAGEIDHRETGGRQAFVEPLARLDVAGADQQPGEVVQPGIVPTSSSVRTLGSVFFTSARMRSMPAL